MTDVGRNVVECGVDVGGVVETPDVGREGRHAELLAVDVADHVGDSAPRGCHQQPCRCQQHHNAFSFNSTAAVSSLHPRSTSGLALW